MYSKLESGDLSENDADKKEEEEPRPMSLFELLVVLRPYFWPDDGSDGAFLNRCRSTATWLMVFLSKASNLMSPFFLANATNAVAERRFNAAARDLICYAALKASSSLFKELQSIIYMKVKQQANIQVKEIHSKNSILANSYYKITSLYHLCIPSAYRADIHACTFSILELAPIEENGKYYSRDGSRNLGCGYSGKAIKVHHILSFYIYLFISDDSCRSPIFSCILFRPSSSVSL